DWVRDEYGHPTHPLALRALNGSVRLWQTCDQLGLEELDDADIAELVGEYQTTAAKLSGALDDLAFDRELRDGAFIVAYLKRALSHLHGAQAALEKVVTRELLPEDRSTAIRTEFFALREAILELMKRFRTEP
ncbi:MAG TPA: hypothetical protein VLT36_25235, partial [Candidatus Dormibacteraeota bacterium]|nr:hypothetical protein [Candidatus Dormibacteraeota bacterium]